MAKKIKKIVLAYSGGLDTSVILPWLKDKYDCGRLYTDARQCFAELKPDGSSPSKNCAANSLPKIATVVKRFSSTALLKSTVLSSACGHPQTGALPKARLMSLARREAESVSAAQISNIPPPPGPSFNPGALIGAGSAA